MWFRGGANIFNEFQIAIPFVKVQTEIHFDCTIFEIDSTENGCIFIYLRPVSSFISKNCLMICCPPDLVRFNANSDLITSSYRHLECFRKHILIVHERSFTIISNLANANVTWTKKKKLVRANNLVQYSVTLLHIFTKATWCFRYKNVQRTN